MPVWARPTNLASYSGRSLPTLRGATMNNRYLTLDSSGRQVAVSAAPTSGADYQSFNFSWGDASPALLTTVPAGKRLLSVTIIVLPAFDVSSVVAIGVIGTPNLFAELGYVTASGEYEFVGPLAAFSVDTGIYLNITRGSGTSAGGGTILLQVV